MGLVLYFLFHVDICIFKDEICQAVGPEAFELGLLMGTECDPLEEEQGKVYSFHHLMLLEFVAAKYVITLDDVSDY